MIHDARILTIIAGSLCIPFNSFPCRCERFAIFQVPRFAQFGMLGHHRQNGEGLAPSPIGTFDSFITDRIPSYLPETCPPISKPAIHPETHFNVHHPDQVIARSPNPVCRKLAKLAKSPATLTVQFPQFQIRSCPNHYNADKDNRNTADRIRGVTDDGGTNVR